MRHQKITVQTTGRGCREITADIQQVVRASGVSTGICHVFIHHTSASLMITENADPEVLADLERFMFRLVPDGDELFDHVAEGPDDMPAHVRSVLTQTHLTLPIAKGACDLGTWQGVFLWEHRSRPHHRHITVSVQG